MIYTPSFFSLQTREVLSYVLRNTLKLAHPYMPFITEELWQAVPNDSQALICSPWPSTGLIVDEEAVNMFSSFQAVVRSVRNARAEYNVEPGKKIAASIVSTSEEMCKIFDQEIQSLALLARLDKDAITVAQGIPEKPDDSKQIELVVKEGLEVIVPLAGLFDAAKEIERLRKQADKIFKELEGLNKRLSNKNFVEKAPEDVVTEVQAAAKEASDQLAAVEEKIRNFENL